MRKLTRIDAPECLQKNSSRWTKNYLNRIQKNSKANFTWPSNSAKPIRERLAEMTRLRCAFCDEGLLTSSPNTIEHFRPKHSGAFPELAYTWENLFPCCFQCQLNKRDQFDDRLLNPDADDYSFDRYYIFNSRTGEIEISPMANLIDQERARITCDFYGLNSTERQTARWNEFRKWEKCRDSGEFTLDDFNYRFFLELEAL